MSNIVLTGFRGTGKSAVGRAVARRLGREFVDMDAVIEARAGKSIPRIFAEDGEPAAPGLTPRPRTKLSLRLRSQALLETPRRSHKRREHPVDSRWKPC